MKGFTYGECAVARLSLQIRDREPFDEESRVYSPTKAQIQRAERMREEIERSLKLLGDL